MQKFGCSKKGGVQRARCVTGVVRESFGVLCCVLNFLRQPLLFASRKGQGGSGATRVVCLPPRAIAGRPIYVASSTAWAVFCCFFEVLSVGAMPLVREQRRKRRAGSAGRQVCGTRRARAIGGAFARTISAPSTPVSPPVRLCFSRVLGTGGRSVGQPRKGGRGERFT